MTDYVKKSGEQLRQAEKHHRRAEAFAALNVVAVVVTAALAGVAAVTAQTDVPTWVTSAAAGLSAGLVILTANYDLRGTSAKHMKLAADRRTLANLCEEVSGMTPMPVAGPWSRNLAQIESLLDENKPIPDGAKWDAAYPPSPVAV